MRRWRNLTVGLATERSCASRQKFALIQPQLERRALVPIILQLLRESLDPPTSISSVVDVGGGIGAWALAFKNNGCERIKVVDSDAAKANSLVSDEEFETCNLAVQLPKAANFDLAISLECAEHLPATQSVQLIKYLTQSAPIVLFSAAVPGQPGLGHINCQRPSYWHELFSLYGYGCFDVIRPITLYQSSIPTWYRQNLFLYLRHPFVVNTSIQRFPEEFTLIANSNYAQIENPSIRRIVNRLAPALLESIRFHIRNLLQR